MSIDASWESALTGRARWSWPLLGPALLSIVYYLAAEAAFAIGTLTQQFAPFWPPNVVLLCALLLLPRRQWPLYIVATFPAHVLAEWGAAMPVLQLLAAFFCNVSVAYLNAISLSWLLRGPPWLGSLRNASLYLLAAVVVNPALVAFAAGFEPTLGDGDPTQYWQYWWRWYLSNALCSLTLTPVFLTNWGKGLRRPRSKPSWRRLIEGLSVALGLIASCIAAFDTQLTRITADFFPAILYLPVPLLLAAAVRFGAKGASGAILIVTVMVLGLAMHGDEPFAGGPAGNSVLSVQLFLAIITVPTILLAALVEELQRTSDRLGAVLDGISDCYYTLDQAGQVTAVNAKGAAWWGTAAPQELIGRNFREVISDRPEEQAWVERTIQAGIAARGEVCLAEGQWADVHAYPSSGGFSIFYHDITERRVAETAARATQELLQCSLDALNAQIAILDSTGRIIAVNAAWRQAAEVTVRHGECYFVGANYIEECERARPHQQMIAAGLRRVLRGELQEFRVEYKSDFVEGAWFQMRGTRFGRADSVRIVIANEDITEVKLSEGALRWLTGRLLRTQDEERRRIARELHDSTAQNLLGATLGIGQALRLAPRLKSIAKAALRESCALIEQSQREIRTVSYLLHPPMLDELGLPAALRWFCGGFAKRTEIAVDLDIAPDVDRMSLELEAALFRVAQESLTNVHRHSGSTKVRLGLRLSDPPGAAPSVRLEIEDDGRGMPADIDERPGSTTRSHDLQNMGIGLAGMRERVRQFGGWLDIDSTARGTTVRVTVPLSAKEPLIENI